MDAEKNGISVSMGRSIIFSFFLAPPASFGSYDFFAKKTDAGG
jgi:hypothetical protein